MSGGKAGGLAALLQMGLRVPRSIVIASRALKRLDRGTTRARLRHELLDRTGLSDRSYAVRSSAGIEDRAEASHAGQFRSVLWVRGIEPMMNAIDEVWRSGAESGENGPPGSGEMEVLIQEMVPAVSAGASFSRNPVTGADEVIVEAVEGTSEALLQHGHTPQRWVTRDEEVTSEWAPLPTDALREIVRTTTRVARELRFPADLEWAFDGDVVWWLQVRPITSLRGLSVYSNRISREYLPGVVMPLVWSINVPMINGAWVDLFERLVGPLDVDPLSLAKRFHGRAYFNMSGMGVLFRRLGLPEDALEQVSGLVPTPGRSPLGFRWRMLRHLPRVVGFAVALSCFRRRLPRWETAMHASFDRAKRDLSEAETLDDLVRWIHGFLPAMRTAARQRIISLVLHMTVGLLGRRALKSRGIEDPSELESADPRLEPYDPMPHLQRLAETLREVSPGMERKVSELPVGEWLRTMKGGALEAQWDRFLDRFGHLSDSGNDFSAIPWRERPETILRVLSGMAEGQRENEKPRRPTRIDRRAKRWARRVTARRLDRERVGFTFSIGVHLLRQWAFCVGWLLVQEHAASVPEDVFFLELGDIEAISLGETELSSVADAISRRKKELEAAASVVLPDLIFGDRVSSAPDSSEEKDVLRGLATARGIYEGPARVIRSVTDCEDMEDGDVLVVPFSDVAWTPLFARAGAIVAEAGGILSHSSIVARESGVPAVVSVSSACSRLPGKRVRVDGYDGTVTVLDAS